MFERYLVNLSSLYNIGSSATVKASLNRRKVLVQLMALPCIPRKKEYNFPQQDFSLATL